MKRLRQAGTVLATAIVLAFLAACGGGSAPRSVDAPGGTSGAASGGSQTLSSNSQPSLQIDTGSYQLISSERTGRTTFTYTYRVNLINQGTAATNVHATVTSSVATTTIIDGDVSFGSVPAGATVTSTDTFSFSQDRTVAFDPSKLLWTVAGDASTSSSVSLTTPQPSMSQGDVQTLTITLPASVTSDRSL